MADKIVNASVGVSPKKMFAIR